MNQPAFSYVADTPSSVSPGKAHFEIHSLKWLNESLLLETNKEERLRHYEITWFRSCAGNIKVDAVTYALQENLLYCLVPGQVRNYQASEMEGYRISFSADYLHIGLAHTRIAPWLDMYNPGENIAAVEADAEMQAEMLEIVRKMQKEFLNGFMLRSEILAGLLNILLIHFSRKLQISFDHTGTKDADLVRRFKTSLNLNYIYKKLVTDYASELCVSPNYLNRTVKKLTGFTASHHIQQQIIAEAKRCAIHSNGSMKEIAYFLGFDNLAHFSKFFKNNCGMNFTSFRKGLVFDS